MDRLIEALLPFLFSMGCCFLLIGVGFNINPIGWGIGAAAWSVWIYYRSPKR